MEKRIHAIALAGLLLITSGCGHDERIGRLEKQVGELQGEVKKNQAVVDYDLQAKCSKDARTWFNENWAGTKAMLLDFSNHYDKALNKCFIFVEFHYEVGVGGTWVNDMTLWDVYENTKYGTFSQTTYSSLKGEFQMSPRVGTCELLVKKCTTVDEFYKLVNPYLND
jgi:hypothetical protein